MKDCKRILNNVLVSKNRTLGRQIFDGYLKVLRIVFSENVCLCVSFSGKTRFLYLDKVRFMNRIHRQQEFRILMYKLQLRITFLFYKRSINMECRLLISLEIVNASLWMKFNNFLISFVQVIGIRMPSAGWKVYSQFLIANNSGKIKLLSWM